MHTSLEEQLLIDEGLRLMPYVDSVGKLTIGVGRNLADRGISKEEALFLLKNDINNVMVDLRSNLPWFSSLTQARQDVLANMCFNLGIVRLLKFKHTLDYIRDGEYDKAADEMLNSKWALQVGDRAKRLSAKMRTG